MSKPYLFMMMGHAGSGKSYFARQLSEREKIVRFNADAMRMAFFGSLESMTNDTIPQKIRREGGLEAVNYAVEQTLAVGYSAICDTANNRLDVRQKHALVAARHQAVSAVIWIKTPKDLAFERVQTRPEGFDQRRWDAERATEVIERMIANTDEPSDSENVIVIDGTIPFEEQYKSFKEQLAEIENE